MANASKKIPKVPLVFPEIRRSSGVARCSADILAIPAIWVLQSRVFSKLWPMRCTMRNSKYIHRVGFCEWHRTLLYILDQHTAQPGHVLFQIKNCWLRVDSALSQEIPGL